MADDYFSYLLREIPGFFQQHASPIEGMAWKFYQVVSKIALIWFFILGMLSGSIDGGRLLSLLMLIVIAGLLLTGYSQPMPGIGISFRSLISDQSYVMCQVIAKDRIQLVQARLHELQAKLAPPGMFEISSSFRYYIIVGLIACAQAATIFSILYGYLVSAMAALLGPFFIPFLLVPGMDWLFWGWLKSYFQFSLYPVFAYAYTSLLAMMLLRFLDKNPRDFLPLVALLLVYVYGLWKLPAVIGSFFGGRSGDSAGPGL